MFYTGESIVIEIIVFTSSNSNARTTTYTGTINMWFTECASKSTNFRKIYIHKIANYRDLHILRKYEYNYYQHSEQIFPQ